MSASITGIHLYTDYRQPGVPAIIVAIERGGRWEQVIYEPLDTVACQISHIYELPKDKPAPPRCTCTDPAACGHYGSCPLRK